MKYPKVGEKFYWKDLHENIHEDVCLSIDNDPDGNIVTNYFTYLTENGGGYFIDEDSILDPESEEVKEYKKKKSNEIVNEISIMMNNEDVIDALINKFINHSYTKNESIKILNILSSL